MCAEGTGGLSFSIKTLTKNNVVVVFIWHKNQTTFLLIMFLVTYWGLACLLGFDYLWIINDRKVNLSRLFIAI